MRPRTIAIGDVHGCLRALTTLLAAVKPRPKDVVVTLGDYVGRGPDSRGVLDRLIELEQQCHLTPLLGNHDQVMLEARAAALAEDPEDYFTLVSDWFQIGGDATLASYGEPDTHDSAAVNRQGDPDTQESQTPMIPRRSIGARRRRRANAFRM